MLRHDVGHELLGLVINVVGIDQDVADIVVEIVPDGAYHQRGLLVDQVGALAALGGAINRAPQFEQVVQVPLQFRRGAPDTCSAGNDAHAVRILQLVQSLLQLGPVIAFDTARHTAAARVIRHQHHITAGQGNEGGQRRSFVAAFFLLDLHQQFLAFANGVLDTRLVGLYTLGKILARYFLERQESVPVFAVIDETRFQRRLDTCHDGLVDIAFALFAAFEFNFVVEQLLSVNNRQSAFFGLGGVDQHPFHG